MLFTGPKKYNASKTPGSNSKVESNNMGTPQNKTKESKSGSPLSHLKIPVISLREEESKVKRLLTF